MRLFMTIIGLIYVSLSEDYVAQGIRRELIRAGRYVAGRAYTSVFG